MSCRGGVLTSECVQLMFDVIGRRPQQLDQTFQDGASHFVLHQQLDQLQRYVCTVQYRLVINDLAPTSPISRTASTSVIADISH